MGQPGTSALLGQPAGAAAPDSAYTVLYEDDDLLAVDKRAGIVIHPAYRHPSGTLFDAIAQRQAERGESRPCLLHRLDRDTSGVVLLAKSERARRALVRQFERRLVRKWYLALALGRFNAQHGNIRLPLRRDPADRRRVMVAADGQDALTHYDVLATHGDRALVLAQPHTGRTHQIRVHLASLGHPIEGDTVYRAPRAGHDPPDAVVRQMLHAWVIRVHHPVSGEPLAIQAPVPADMMARMPAHWCTQCEATWQALR